MGWESAGEIPSEARDLTARFSLVGPKYLYAGQPLRADRFFIYHKSMLSGFQCAGCGEWNETQVDSSAGTRQSYVEDCQICCKPNVLRIEWDMSAGEYLISAELE